MGPVGGVGVSGSGTPGGKISGSSGVGGGISGVGFVAI